MKQANRIDLGQIFTNDTVAEYMVSLLNIDKDSKILDPCFGKGAFIHAALKKQYWDISGYEIDTSLYNKVSENHPQLNLRNEDFLCSSNAVKYDGIVMNPPYIRHEKIDELTAVGIDKAKLRSLHLFEQLPATSNIYMYFILKSIELLKEDGILVVIFPGSWTNTKKSEEYIRILEAKCSLTDVINVHGQAFTESALVDVIILRLQKTNLKSTPNVKNIVVMGNKLTVNNSAICKYTELGFNTSFCQLANVRRGITTGYNEMFINPDVPTEDTVDIISSPKSISGYTTEDAKLDSLLSGSSSEIDRYVSLYRKRILEKKSPKTLYNKILKEDPSWSHIRLFDCQGIIFNYFVRDNIRFIDNAQGYFVRDNFYIIYPRIDQHLLFALLNNYYTFIQLEEYEKLYGAGLLKLQKYDLEKLVFPSIETIVEEDINELIGYARKLISSSNEYYVDKITQTIARYSSITFCDSKALYKNKKKMRLSKHD